MAKITYKNKSSFINLPISDSKEVTAKDMNEIKKSVNDLYDIVEQGGGNTQYLRYVSLINQSGTNDPVATVLENTLGGTPVWDRSAQGYYTCTLNGAFPPDKTLCIVNAGLTYLKFSFGRFESSNYLDLYISDIEGNGVDINNSPVNDVSVEIRVYP